MEQLENFRKNLEISLTRLANLLPTTAKRSCSAQHRFSGSLIVDFVERSLVRFHYCHCFIFCSSDFCNLYPITPPPLRGVLIHHMTIVTKELRCPKCRWVHDLASNKNTVWSSLKSCPYQSQRSHPWRCICFLDTATSLMCPISFSCFCLRLF